MKYVKAIFENEDVKTLVVENESLVDSSTKYLLNYNLFLQENIINYLSNYILENDLAKTYNNIVECVLTENLKLINTYSSIIKSNLNEDQKVSLFEEETEKSEESFLSRHKGKLLGAAALAGTAAAGYAGYNGHLGKDVQKIVSAKVAQAADKMATTGMKAGMHLRDKGHTELGDKLINKSFTIASPVFKNAMSKYLQSQNN